MRVADLMRSDVKTVSPSTPVSEIVQLMADAHISGVPVVGTDGALVGVVSATDVLEAAADREDERARTDLFENTTARDLMTSQPLTVAANADVREAAQQMLYAEVKRLFVEDAGRLVGVVSQTDIAYAVGTGRI
ncbi:MAG: CBS domain-containing protein [Gemmatimonadales bacterium]|jgi:CBS domain-containing protein